jgi:hypothetical protein
VCLTMMLFSPILATTIMCTLPFVVVYNKAKVGPGKMLQAAQSCTNCAARLPPGVSAHKDSSCLVVSRHMPVCAPVI